MGILNDRDLHHRNFLESTSGIRNPRQGPLAYSVLIGYIGLEVRNVVKEMLGCSHDVC